VVSRLIDTWEKLPVHIQGEEKKSVEKKKIKSSASKYVQSTNNFNNEIDQKNPK
jgi:hypothetical protein